jgi:hypothetical protein
MSRVEFKKKEEASVETPKVEELKPVAERVIPVQPEKVERQNIVVHSELDVMLLDRAKSQPKSLTEIDSEVIVKPKEGRHQLSLPVELEPYTKKYAFCWIFKRKKAIDEASDLYHYYLTNQTYFSDLPDHLFSARGIIERGDNVLMFRSKKVDEEMRKVPGLESLQAIKARTQAHEGNPNFYVPTADSKEEGKVVGV